MYKLKITLQSDLCSGSGENYGAMIDNDICYDRYGLPYIPAKRLRGCLRESARELVEFGLYTADMLDGLFGLPGQSDSSALRVEGAYLDGYENIQSDIINEVSYKDYLDPQRVLDHYTYLRAQTAINDKGVATPRTLRYTRVAHKDLSFNACIHIAPAYFELYKDVAAFLRDIASNFRMMGLNRNRGLGEIKAGLQPCSIEDDTSRANAEALKGLNGAAADITYDEDQMYVVPYVLSLITPLIIRDGDGKSENCVPGSTIMGYFAKSLGGDFKRFTDNSILFSNAYITDNGLNQYYPAPAYLNVPKYAADQPKEGAKAYSSLPERNEGAPDDAPIKTKAMPGVFCCFDGGRLLKLDVDADLDYHLDRDEQAFFQYISIKEGQRFRGHITVKGKYLHEILDFIDSGPTIALGRSRIAQYGLCKIKLIRDPDSGAPFFKAGKTAGTAADCFVVTLRAPAIFYNGQGMSVASADILRNKLEKALNAAMDDGMKCTLSIEKQYVRGRSAGGYNVTWNLPKPRQKALAAGSAFLIRSDKPVDIGKLDGISLGEFACEGYGEISAVKYTPVSAYDLKRGDASENAAAPTKQNHTGNGPQEGDLQALRKTDIVENVMRTAILKLLDSKGMEEAVNSIKNGKINSTTIGKLILMLNEHKAVQSFYNCIDNIKDKTKKDEIIAIVKCREKTENIVNGVLQSVFEREKNAPNEARLEKVFACDQDRFFTAYMKAFLQELKLLQRTQKVSERSLTRNAENDDKSGI